MYLPPSIIEVNDESFVSKLLKSFIMMTIHVACIKAERYGDKTFLIFYNKMSGMSLKKTNIYEFN